MCAVGAPESLIKLFVHTGHSGTESVFHLGSSQDIPISVQQENLRDPSQSSDIQMF